MLSNFENIVVFLKRNLKMYIVAPAGKGKKGKKKQSAKQDQDNLDPISLWHLRRTQEQKKLEMVSK